MTLGARPKFTLPTVPKWRQVENKKVVFIDDVLFTGRSIRAALTAINSYGRPESVELLVLCRSPFQQTFAHTTRLCRRTN